MASLVEQLQAEAADGKSRVSDLLRKAKLVAVKLNQEDMAAWVDAELNGEFDTVPEYRKVPTRPVWRNPIYGYVPFVMDNARMNEVFNSPRYLPMPIAELEALLGSDERVFYMSLPESIHQHLAERGVDIRPLSQISSASVAAILDAIRTAILDWALKLEANGVVGTDVGFSPDEKQRAKDMGPAEIHIYGNIGNFSGVIGTSTGTASVNANQTAGIDVAAAARIAATLREAAKDLPPEDADLAVAAAHGIDDAVAHPTADQGRLRKALSLAKAALPKVGAFLAKAAIEGEIAHLLGG